MCGVCIGGRSTNLVTSLSLFIVPHSYDVIFTVGADVILKKFQDFKSRVVFSAEGFCWPDKSLAVSFYQTLVIPIAILY